MAIINAAVLRNVGKQVMCAAIAISAALSVAACSTGSAGLLAGFTQQPSDTSSVVQPNSALIQAKGDIAIVPLIGPPDAVATRLTAQIAAELAKKSIKIVRPVAGGASSQQKSKYTLRGYVVAASEVGGVKISYIWDIIDTSGQRVERISGENLVKGAASNDPWSAISPTVLTKIAGDTAANVAKWWPQRSSSVPTANARVVKSSNDARLSTASASSASSTLSSGGKKTGRPPAAASSKLAVYVPSVTGAPGDGSTSLSTALRSQLRKNGLRLAKSSIEASHTIEGNVVVGASRGGQQPIQIDWVVKTPVGKKLGTVSQKNKIPVGSLDGEWGATASVAASAAAQGIIKLLPKTMTVARS